MLLLSISIVLALVLGAFSFGILGPSADKATLTMGRLNGGVTSDNVTVTSTASFVLELNNPGKTQNITGIQLTESGWTSPITNWAVTPDSQIGNSFMTGGHNTLPGGRVSTFTLYPVASPSVSITVDETFYYVITLSDGQSISGYLTAQ